VQDSSFYGADQIGLHPRKEAQSNPTKCLIIQRALGKFPSMNCTSKYTPSSKLYRILADPFHQFKKKALFQLSLHLYTNKIQYTFIALPFISQN